MTDISFLKKQLRQQLTDRRLSLSALQRNTYSAAIIEHLYRYLAALPETAEPLQLLVYHALPVEVDTFALFHQQQYQVFAPRMLPDHDMAWVAIDQQTIWHEMDYGVLEPRNGELWQPGHSRTILISPLLGFDRAGDRLGMGKGFFDRWLEKHGSDLELQLGLAFSCQELPKIPVEPHDAPLSAIITESGVIPCPTH